MSNVSANYPMYRQSYWVNVLDSYLRKRAKAEGTVSLTIKRNDIAHDVGGDWRYVTKILKVLRDRQHIDIEFHVNAPSTYTILPLEPRRKEQLNTVARLLSLSLAEAMRAITRLVNEPYDPKTVRLYDLAHIAGYTGEPKALVIALREAGIIGADGHAGW